MRFTKFSHYTALLVSTKRESVNIFVKGLTYRLRFGMAREMETKTTFYHAMEISKRLERIRRLDTEDREAKKPCDYRGFSGSYSGPRFDMVEVISADQFSQHFRFHVVLQLAMDFRVLV